MVDSILHVEFPNKIGDLQMSYRHTYEKGAKTVFFSKTTLANKKGIEK